jgi:predicted nucleic acid-binding protein
MEASLVDSNILLRLTQPAHPEYAVTSAAVAKLLKQNTDLCVVPQNLVEFWAVASRPSANRGGLGMKPDAVDGEMQRLRSLFHLLEGAQGIADSWQQLVKLHQVSGKQVHDAHLVAAMQVYGLQNILTFNGEDFKRYPGIMVINPVDV